MIAIGEKFDIHEMKDSIGMQKVEEKSKQFLIEKIIHGVEFNNPYNIEIEKKPEIIETVEMNYRVARTVYLHLWIDISELFAEFIRSVLPLDLQDMDENINSNSWGIKKITDVENSLDLINIFQTFH